MHYPTKEKWLVTFNIKASTCIYQITQHADSKYYKKLNKLVLHMTIAWRKPYSSYIANIIFIRSLNNASSLS